MNNEMLRQLIIRMAHKGIARGEIIKSLVSQGYYTSDIERVFNELYYAGLLTQDAETILQEAGIKSIKNLLSPQVTSTNIHTSKITRMRIWFRIHPRITIGIIGSIISLLVALGAGIGAYESAHTTRVNRALASLAQAPALAYHVATTTFSLPNSDTFTISAQGAMRSRPVPQASMEIFLQKNSLTPWKFTVIHSDHDTIYMYITQGPLPYPFLYNRWIQFSAVSSDVQLLRVFGFNETVLNLGIFHSFAQTDMLQSIQSFASTQTSYTNLSEYSSTSSCDQKYKILFRPNVLNSLMSTLLGSSIYAQNRFQIPWDICIVNKTISSVSIPAFVSRESPSFMVITLEVPTLVPSFSVDAITTPLATVIKWAQENNPGVVAP